jgi:hypothetical protein
MRSEIDYETNVLSEVWLEAIADNLGLGTDVLRSAGAGGPEHVATERCARGRVSSRRTATS